MTTSFNSTIKSADETATIISWKTQYLYISHIFAVIVSTILVFIISFETFSNSHFLTDTIYAKLELSICLYFMLDTIFLWCISDDKWKIFRRYLIIFLLSIPYSGIIHYFSLALPNEVLYLVRFIPLVRGGVALAMLVFMTVKNIASGLLISYILLLLSTSYFLSLIFYVFEAGVNPLVKNYGDVIWWAAMTVTTLGSNIIAVTVVGKVVTTILAAVGMMIFPVFTVYVTSVVQRMNHPKK